MLNEQREDYIRAIYLISLRKGVARGKDMSEYLKVSKNTVSAMLVRLSDENYISHKNYGTVALTKKGTSLAKQLTMKHRLIELFLVKILKHQSNEVHSEACRLEHDFSQKSISAMNRLLGNPRLDPHGSQIYQ
ncbi:MAG: metal-dependent transcriptional regulator [Candidatus Micrarchaeota archaeon]|nr:metal-dependent transcriptional regulator [Candidatus Micrarchaeota archaeon]